MKHPVYSARALAQATAHALARATAVLFVAAVPWAAMAQAGDKLDRSVLPIAEAKRPAVTEIDVRKAKMPSRFEVKAPAKAPNVVIVLIDDMGFGVPSTFGGPVAMPTLD